MTDARVEAAPLDHIEAIAIGIESLGFDIGAGYERRAKASFIEQALKLSGFSIAALSTPPQVGLTREGTDAAAKTGLSHSDIRSRWKAHGGGFHGPRVEHANIEEGAFYRFIDELILNERRAAIDSAAPHVAPPQQRVEAAADAIDEARYRHPTHPRERPRPFSEADKGDREYAFRLARAALEAPHVAPQQEQIDLADRIDRHIADCAAHEGHVFDLYLDEQRLVVNALRAPAPHVAPQTKTQIEHAIDHFEPPFIADLANEREMWIADNMRHEILTMVRSLLPHVAGGEETATEGWQLVPKEPTDEMTLAGADRRDEIQHDLDNYISGVTPDWDVWMSEDAVYRAMLSAAPRPAPTGGGELRDAMQEACDLLAERKHGNPARSPGHNARLCLEATIRMQTGEGR